MAVASWDLHKPWQPAAGLGCIWHGTSARLFALALASMGSWARVAGQDARAQPGICSLSRDLPPKPTAVVDTNAIIAGIQPHSLAERIVTLVDVLEEVRDAKSRDFLARLPFGIDTAEPTAASLTAVRRFARATGDLQSLSNVDLRVLALTHTLEVEANGSSHLNSLPTQQILQTKGRHPTQDVPGWGDTGSTWAQLDKLNEEEETRHGTDHSQRHTCI